MMIKSKIEEFHIPFIKNLVFIVIMTLVSMVSAHYFIQNTMSYPSESPQYTSDRTQNELE
jgi:hypothetical protein